MWTDGFGQSAFPSEPTVPGSRLGGWAGPGRRGLEDRRRHQPHSSQVRARQPLLQHLPLSLPLCLSVSPTHTHTHPHPHTHTYTPKPQRARAWSGLYVNSELSFWFFFKYETILQQENSLFFKRIRTFKRWKVVRRRSNQKCPVIPVELQMAWLRHVGNLEGAAKAEHLHVLRPAAIFPGHTTQK